MGSGENSRPAPLASPPLAKKEVQTEGEPVHHRPRRPSAGGRSQSHVAIQFRKTRFWEDKQHEAIPISVSEVFREELSYRAQARKFLWEFFD